MSSRSAFIACSVAALATGLCATAAPAAADGDLDNYVPVNPADYLVADPAYKGTVFFTTPDGRHCAIYWNNGYTGCDAVSLDAPAGTNQLRVARWEAANFLNSPEQTFTHPEAKVLPEGHKITHDQTTCGIGYQGTVNCEVVDHGFVLSAVYSVLH
ncbi:hypothetical protein [Nocardia goodfellowii]|uniref:Lipoprotein n=1 Tax=Nocardia goodfellowii TaxID=882446 RepID=A0ABS4QF67_9NOCA|nr:hypothetical protein [Nocardia goodfellowii]MBP2190349.1 hypothetical protein [Nocardia goodfellowii]